jgi:hypothetical protein
MANFKCIAAAGKSIERVLNACFAAEQPVQGKQAKAVLVRSDDFQRLADAVLPTTGVSIFLYRADLNKVMRAAWSGVGSIDGQAHLPIDLHYLITAWAENAEYEQQVLGRTMQCLEELPSLSGPILYPSADWAPNEAVHLVVEDVPMDSLMRTFDSLDADFRLSIPYLARVVRLDGAPQPVPTVATAITGLTPSADGA